MKTARIILPKLCVPAALLALGLTGCMGAAEDGSPISHTYRVSECGGFDPPATTFKRDPGYCDAEILSWSYDAEAQVLSLKDSRAILNCCGIHGMSASLQGGVYVVTEIDEPMYSDGRCGCECVYDFGIDLEGVPAGPIALRLVRNVTDSGEGPETLVTLDLDTSQGAGEELIDDRDATYICELPEGL